MSEKIPCISTMLLDKQLKQEYLKAFESVVDRSFYVMGSACDAFEKEFGLFCNRKYCIGTGNGLDALAVILMSLGVGDGDEVILPSNSYIASVLAVTRVGAVPVFTEPDIRTGNMEPAGIADKITDKTRVIMPVHLYGQPCEMRIARRDSEHPTGAMSI